MTGQPATNPSAAPAAAIRGAPGADRIDLMQTFVRIVEAGSLSLAAAQLQTTQPTISRRLQTLERLLGVRLLQRSTHAMKLTEDGARCYERARELVADWARFEADVRGVGHAPSGTLRVVVPHAFGQEVLVGPLADYLRQYPQVAVEWLLHDRTPDFIAEAIDCAIHVGEVHEPGLVAVRLAEVPRAVIAAPSLFDGKPLPRRPQDLEGLPWLALRTFYRNEIVLQNLQTEARQGLSFAPRMSTDSLYALHAAARLGLGVAVGSSWIFADDIASGRLLHLLPQWQADPLPIYLVYPHARFYPAKLRLFADAMRQAIPTAGMVERRRVPRGRGAGRMPQARR
ncbi:Regulatory protein, LysR:LysR, substrate-binding [Cupriavidus taiwanensis]|uniref:LysR family transcriptional regulator n=1 Tax=Cupriavidus taiwanensis TaxID=164546 RepID=UPI000E184704|nr:LysR family transcriptional regulator [Cupriavidus taiwanensis]SOY93117.1 Regulatory protein, LysR:LysR, substrate-binding [Cupriavidus taiwanensis]SOY96636.1 Regulatory protein, LysR:LysR, substrate-binding [Cupriavidus taiwanensis]